MKVEEIRPGSSMSGQVEAMQCDIDWLAAHRPGFVTVACPACGVDRTQPLYEKYGMQHVRCQVCRTQYVNPRPDAAVLAAFYASSANYAYWAQHIFPRSREARREKIFAPRAQIVREMASAAALSDGVLVEVGAAHGLFCDEVRKLGCFSRIIGIEPTPDLARDCRALGIETIEAPVEQVEIDVAADVVASFEVIEHLFDPGAFLHWCLRALKPGGHVLLTCPNIEGFETMLLGRESNTVDHEHLNLMHPESLVLLATRCGFADPQVSTPGLLDVEIVRSALEDGSIAAQQVPAVIQHLVRHPDASVTDDLQDLVRRARLSSNMLLTARRPLEI